MAERLPAPRFEPYLMERDSNLGKVSLTVEGLDRCSTSIDGVVVVFVRTPEGQLRVEQDLYSTDTVRVPLNHARLVRAQMFAESVLADIAVQHDPEAAAAWQRTFGAFFNDAQSDAAQLAAEDDERAGVEGD